ncbi:YopX family protein [Macrococcoides caseolyticum]|uniref:YopX protein domain-containing protein n=1 Tax=Macrococcus caseolyticus (strain JCSC5402) TaxID=458233 RepID=B9E7S3_MACCJ|nr:YopX family protein [Macrococcus caseolyticus]BAH18241.1 conserved hypothetical protein [Macrococcus caseolyticus JCSC5402]
MIPKFRMIDPETNQLKEVFFIDLLRGNVWFDADEEAVGYKLEDVHLMQSTGLHDENKEEVFQDDIVWHDQNEEYGVVEIDEAKFVIRWQNGYSEDLFERIDLLEVVGNIHEHPELLIQPNE